MIAEKANSSHITTAMRLYYRATGELVIPIIEVPLKSILNSKAGFRDRLWTRRRKRTEALNRMTIYDFFVEKDLLRLVAMRLVEETKLVWGVRKPN